MQNAHINVSDSELSPEYMKLAMEKLDALPIEQRSKITAVLLTEGRDSVDIETQLEALGKQRDTVLIVETPAPEEPEHKPSLAPRMNSMLASMMALSTFYAPDMAALRMPSPAGSKYCTGRHVEGSCCAKGYKAPDKIGRNTLCPCHSGKKYKHCKLKGLCNA